MLRRADGTASNATDQVLAALGLSSKSTGQAPCPAPTTRAAALNSSPPAGPDCLVKPTTAVSGAGQFTTRVPEFTIDLDRPESERWKEVIAATKGPTLALVREAQMEIELVPSPIRYLVGLTYKLLGRPYAKDMQAIAEGYGLPVSTVTMLNYAYGLSHLPRGSILGCTAATAYAPTHGMMHLRTLDWPLPTMGPATCVLRMKKQGREFVVVGIPGQMGVLSGMKPGGYSVTINWAPPGRLPGLREDPTFLLRRVLETCDTYDEAVAMLRDSPLSTSVFYTVCGVERGDACVIERTQDDAEVRRADGDTVVQANHYETARFIENNGNAGALEGAEFLEQSGARSRALEAAVKSPIATPRDFVEALDVPPVLNKDTVQKIVFLPKTGEVVVWRLAK